MMIAGHLVDPAAIPVSWADIAGLEDVIEELRETVILPIQKKELFADSQLTQPPKGIVLVLQKYASEIVNKNHVL
jgi:ATP-dependent 26S proteasome regulatory subunit